MRIGARIILNKRLDLSPHAVIEKGETGEVDSIDNKTGEIWMRLDKYHPGLSEWMNHIWLNEYSSDVADAISIVELLSAA
jgi:hypothetical protein